MVPGDQFVVMETVSLILKKHAYSAHNTTLQTK
jgi:hypothetical protein